MSSPQNVLRTALTFIRNNGEPGTWGYFFRWSTKTLVGLLIVSLFVATLDYWYRSTWNIKGTLFIVAAVASPLLVTWFVAIVGFLLSLLIIGLDSSLQVVRWLCAFTLLVLGLVAFGWCAKNGSFSGSECRYDPDLCQGE